MLWVPSIYLLASWKAAFSVAAPVLWKEVPPPNLDGPHSAVFKRPIKTWLFAPVLSEGEGDPSLHHAWHLLSLSLMFYWFYCLLVVSHSESANNGNNSRRVKGWDDLNVLPFLGLLDCIYILSFLWEPKGVIYRGIGTDLALQHLTFLEADWTASLYVLWGRCWMRNQENVSSSPAFLRHGNQTGDSRQSQPCNSICETWRRDPA